MALITDPDFLNQGAEVVFDTTNRTIALAETGNMDSGGVTLQALYSFTKEEWKDDAALIRFPFPFVAITSEQFEVVNGWTFLDQDSINLIRNAGFAVKGEDGSSQAEYIGVITLGEIGTSDQVYYQQESGGTSTDVVLTGAVNQCIKVYGDATNGDFDYRDFFKIFVREQGKSYASADKTDIGVTTFTYQAYRFPLANFADLKITHSDVTADAYGVTIDYTTTVQRNIGGTNYDFDIVIDGNDRTAEEIYEAVQSALRKNSDIDNGAGTVVGVTADELLTFVGDTLVTSTGVYIDNFQSTDINRIEFFDNSNVKRTFPFVASGIINFNDNLVNDGNAIYKMFFTDLGSGQAFGTSNAIIVDNNAGSDIEGTITGPTASFDFDYDNNTQGGRSPGTDESVTVVAIGLNTGQYVSTVYTITRDNANNISLVAALERNYQNL